MLPAQLKTARMHAGWTQEEAASRLGVSQPYYSQLEGGSRPMPGALAAMAVRKLGLSPATLPLPGLARFVTPVRPGELAAALARLGYPGFAHLPKTGRLMNPAELVARALAHDDLEPRLVEGLPWVLATFHDLDWQWLVSQCRLLDLQNRLGFLLSLADQLAKPRVAEHLREPLASLERSRLAAEGTLCREKMPDAERKWTRNARSSDAARWNLLTSLTVDQLTHAH